MTTGLVAAMPAELDFPGRQPLALNTPFRIRNGLVAIICGIGAGHARHASELLLYQQVSGLVSWGVAAGLDAAEAGDLLLPEVIIGRNGRQLQTDRAWREYLTDKLRDFPGNILNSPLAETRLLLESVEQKQSLHNETGAIAADMESATIARIAEENHLPCLVVRTVVDRHDLALPYEITRHTDVYGNPQITGIIMEILRKPRLLPQVITLGRAMQKAMATLKSVADRGDDAFAGFY